MFSGVIDVQGRACTQIGGELLEEELKKGIFSSPESPPPQY